jgi:hypothetical protein
MNAPVRQIFLSVPAPNFFRAGVALYLARKNSPATLPPNTNRSNTRMRLILSCAAKETKAKSLGDPDALDLQLISGELHGYSWSAE